MKKNRHFPARACNLFRTAGYYLPESPKGQGGKMKKLLLVLLLASLLPATGAGPRCLRLEKKDSIAQVFKFSSPGKSKDRQDRQCFRLHHRQRRPDERCAAGSQENPARRQPGRPAQGRARSEAEHGRKRQPAGYLRRRPFPLPQRLESTGPIAIIARPIDFTLQVPEQTSLILKTVNDGDILVRNIKGDFTVRNVNGHIELQDIAGPVSCRTVNGRIRAAFREDPAVRLFIHHGQRRPGCQLQPQAGRRFPIEDSQR